MRLISHGGVEKGLNVLNVCINWLHEGTPGNDWSNKMPHDTAEQMAGKNVNAKRNVKPWTLAHSLY
tara:strand:- start:956 stop:1153 length:198 start_codon:yes stop_codon:yes gene_type:complete